MPDFPYSTVIGKLKTFFEKIQTIGIPDTANTKWLPSIGFRSSNDPSILTVARFIGFIDQSAKPTQYWRDYRDKSRSSQVMADCLRRSYDELFNTYPDAYNRSDEELKNFFSTKTSAGDQAVIKTVGTFKALCSLADFTQPNNPPTPNRDTSNIPSQGQNEIVPHKVTYSPEVQSGLTVNINIELSLPSTTEKEVYDNLFAALKKHILSGNNADDK